MERLVSCGAVVIADTYIKECATNSNCTKVQDGSTLEKKRNFALLLVQQGFADFIKQINNYWP